MIFTFFVPDRRNYSTIIFFEMIILKAQKFSQESDVVKFININNIKREDIFEITAVTTPLNTDQYTIFFYADSAAQEITRGFFGW